MAFSDQNASPAQALPGTETPPAQIQQQTDQLPSNTPVEMSQLSSYSVTQQSPTRTSSPLPAAQSDPSNEPKPDQQPQAVDETLESEKPQTPEPASIPSSRPTRDRQVSEAIGPSAEDSATASTLLQQSSNLETGPAVLITLILLNGARHPYKIDQKYLRKRNVASEGDDIDPYSISVYTMKELIWRDWREEWDPRPTIPGAIRLIYFGRLLDDKQTLSDCRFQAATPNAVHMTVRPQEFLDDEENHKSSKLGNGRRTSVDDPEADPGCRCCAIM